MKGKGESRKLHFKGVVLINERKEPKHSGGRRKRKLQLI